MLILGTSLISFTTSITFNLDFGDADPGLGSTATLEGTLSAPIIAINGGADSDTLNFLGPLGILRFDPADPFAGTITSGATMISFSGIESVIGNVQVPEPASVTLLVLGLGVAARRGIGGRPRVHN